MPPAEHPAESKCAVQERRTRCLERAGHAVAIRGRTILALLVRASAPGGPSAGVPVEVSPPVEVRSSPGGGVPEEVSDVSRSRCQTSRSGPPPVEVSGRGVRSKCQTSRRGRPRSRCQTSRNGPPPGRGVGQEVSRSRCQTSRSGPPRSTCPVQGWTSGSGARSRCQTSRSSPPPVEVSGRGVPGRGVPVEVSDIS